MTKNDQNNMFTLGIVLCAATELCLLASDFIVKPQVKREAKFVLSNLLKSMQSVKYWAGRINEVVVGSDKESAAVFDNLLYNSNRLVQVAMMYCDITNGANKNMEQDAEQMFRTLLNLALKAGGQPFSQELINSYEPRI